MEEELRLYVGMLAMHLGIAIRDDVDVRADVVNLQQTGLNAVVKIGGEVGDLVRQIDDLGL